MNNLLLLFFLLNICINGMKDAYQYKYNVEKNKYIRKQYGYIYHWLNVLFIFSFLSIVFLFNFKTSIINFAWLMFGYTLLRFGLFDYIYNIFSGHHLLYIGNTAFIDKIFRKLFPNAKSKMILYSLKAISIIIAFYIFQYKIKLL